MVGGMPRPILFAKRPLLIAALALGIVACAMPAQAQNPRDSFPVVVSPGVHYDTPERLSGSISGLFPLNPIGKAGLVWTGLALRGRVGRGGYGVGIGPRLLVYGPWGPEAMLTVRRTFSSPRSAIGRSTYLGFEVGYQLLGHVSMGVARQVDGPAGRRDTRLTWSVGVEIPYGMWRW